MKIVLFLAMIVSLSTFSLAQPNNVVTAYMNLQEGKLKEAKENIDAASDHDKTSGSAKTWYYRGKIYEAIFQKLNQSGNDEISGVDAIEALLEAARSYRKALKLDTSRLDEADLRRRYAIMANYLLNEGVKEYNENNYPTAIALFKGTTVVQEDFGIIDSLAYFNLALSYEKNENLEEAIKYYVKCAEMDYNPSLTYVSAVLLLRQQGKNEIALDIINSAQNKHPENLDILIAKINLLIFLKEYEDALSALDKALTKMPQNADLHFARGTLLEANDLPEAMACYERAIAIEPNHTNALYNLGAAYYNQAVVLRNADSATSDSGKAELEKSREYLLRVEELSPGIEQVQNSLETIEEILGN